ncbi:MAG TPA: YitT family protein [Candidatus Nanopelagicales bacterium]|nr:YitT family protein [Candidatus Nanopelagicales bacterium]
MTLEEQPRMSSRVVAFLKGSRTVPRTRWTARRFWAPTPASVAALVLGLTLFGIGEAFLLAGTLGATPWTVLAQGLSIRFGTNIGTMTFTVSCIVLLLWIPLRQKPGLGTLANIVVIAVALQLAYDVLPQPSQLGVRLLFVAIGIGITGVGSGFYLTAGHGPGPRDGWMTGLHHRTGRPVALIRLVVEVCVLLVGIALGGTFGIGTVLYALLIGQSVAVGLQLVTHLAPPLPHEGPAHP